MEQSAKVTQQRRISFIWAIPAIALMIATWMLYQYQAQQGILIQINAKDADGIIAGKTEIRVHSVNVGMVESVNLDASHSRVIINALIEPQYATLLNKTTEIWVVKPRVDLTGVSGLGTLFSGFYLEMQPGKSEENSTEFTLLDRPPLISNDVPGKRYTLFSDDTSVLDIGTGVFYNNYQVGQIETATFDVAEQRMTYGIFVYAPYDDLVTESVLFWQRSGVEFNLSADGVNVKTGSLAQVLQGGIAFKVPEREQTGRVASENTEYPLSNSYEEALESRYDAYDYVMMSFKDSIRGLKSGAPVEFRGVRIGTVVESPARLPSGAASLFPSTSAAGVPVLVRIEYKRMNDNVALATKYWKDNVNIWIKQGMRASIKPGNLLTGANYVDMDIYPNTHPQTSGFNAGYPTFPTVSSGFSQISNQVSSVLGKLDQLKVEESLLVLNDTLTAIENLSNNMNGWITQKETQQIPSDMIAAIESLQLSMQAFDKTMRNYDANSQFMVDVSSVLEDIKTITRQLKPVARTLNEQPNMLIFEKRLPADITPPKGN